MCDDDYGRSGSNICLKCSDTGVSITVIIAAIVTLIVVIIVLVY